MSQCLPFPPPGYVWHGVCGEALLELIKVQRERVKAEREKKREKKRRKKEKKKKKHKRLRSNEVEERGEIESKNEYETQKMEKSSLTEELEHPIYDCLYESSDNNHSIQRKRSRRSCNENNTHGSIVQIDFQLQQQKKLELHEMPSIDVQELPHSSERSRISMEYKKSKMNLIESKFKELVVNWIPPLLQIEHFDVGDQDWLFERKPCRSDIWDVCNANICALPYIIGY